MAALEGRRSPSGLLGQSASGGGSRRPVPRLAEDAAPAEEATPEEEPWAAGAASAEASQTGEELAELEAHWGALPVGRLEADVRRPVSQGPARSDMLVYS